MTTGDRDREAWLTVVNTGERLPPEPVATPAEPFRRGTGRIHADQAGVGLGPAIVRRITEAQDGTLTHPAYRRRFAGAGGTARRVLTATT